MVRLRFRARFYVMLAAVVALIAAGVFLLVFASKEGEMATGAVMLSLPVRSVIIRDEVSVPTERYDKILFDVAEGARIGMQDQIAQVFKWGYQEETMQALLDVQKQIQEHQLSLVEGIVNPELDTVIAAIQNKQLEIRAAAGGERGRDMFQLELELKDLLTARMQLLRDVQADETLTALYAQEETQLSNLATWKRDIVNTAGEGIVSFYFDGYEQAVSAQKLDMLTADLLTRVLRGGAVESADSAAMESPLYRLIHDEHFYVAFLTESTEIFRLAEGELYTVVFEGYANTPFTGVALTPVVSGDKIVNLLEFSQPMGDLMGVRVVEATLMKDATGVKVPLSAIRMREGAPGILRMSGTDSIWTEVEVLATNESEAVIRAKNPDETLMAGLRYKES